MNNKWMKGALGALVLILAVLAGVMIGRVGPSPVEEPARTVATMPSPLAGMANWWRLAGVLLIVGAVAGAYYRHRAAVREAAAATPPGAPPTMWESARPFMGWVVAGAYVMALAVPMGWVARAADGRLHEVPWRVACHALVWAAAAWLAPVWQPSWEEALLPWRNRTLAVLVGVVVWWGASATWMAAGVVPQSPLGQVAAALAAVFGAVVAIRLQALLRLPSASILDRDKRRDATVDLVVASVLVALAVVGGGVVLSWWAKRGDTRTAAQFVGQVAAVRGEPRDVFYLKQFGRPVDQPWTPPAPDTADGKVSRAALDAAYGGYTLVLGTGGDRAAGWLPLSELSDEAKERLDNLMRLQGRARERKVLRPDQRTGSHEVIWRDPETGLWIPYRFYQEADSRWFRVMSDEALYGPGGEEVLDISLYTATPEALKGVAEPIQQGWDGKRAYDGEGKARHLNLF